MIFYLSGPDSFRAYQKLLELKTKFLRDVDPSGLNLKTVEGENLTSKDLPTLLTTTSLLAKRRCLIIKRIFKAKDKDLASTLPKLIGGDKVEENIIIFYEPDEPDEKNPLHKWLKEHAHCQKFPLLAGPALRRFITEEAQSRGHAITAGAIDRLLERANQNLWWIKQDLDKCHAFVAAGAPIEEAVLDSLTVESPSAEIFPLVDAILRGDLAVAAPRLMNYLDNEESPQQLIGLLEQQLRTLYLLSSNPNLVRQPIPGIHPFVVKKIAPLAQRRPAEDVKKIYLSLIEVDQDLKSTSLDPKLLLMRWLTSATPS